MEYIGSKLALDDCRSISLISVEFRAKERESSVVVPQLSRQSMLKVSHIYFVLFLLIA